MSWQETPRPASRPYEQQGLHVLAKPVGPICNLNCVYCYFLAKESLYPPGERWRMTRPTLEEFIRQYINAQPAEAPEIAFGWQGGKPTLAGLEFFERVIELQRRWAPPGKRITNMLQTNGTLLDGRWCEFLREHDFLVGISIDGPADLHDRYRVDKQGRATHAAVESAVRLLSRYDVQFNTLTTVNSGNGDQGRRVYRYLIDLGSRFLQFIPIVERRGDRVTPQSAILLAAAGADPSTLVSDASVRPEQWGRFLMDLFDEWIRADVGRVFVQMFDEALAAWLGVEPSLCIFRRECGRALVLEHNGDAYSCDHFVEPAYRLGNIQQLPIIEMVNSAEQRQFASHKLQSLPRYCRQCSVRFACHGECPKNRFLRTPEGEGGLNYLCAGYKAFFKHVDPYMRAMASEVRHGRPAANVMAKRPVSGTLAGA